MNTLAPLNVNSPQTAKSECLSINEIENLKTFEQEYLNFISNYDTNVQMSQKQLAFMVKYPQFAMKLTLRVLKDLQQQIGGDFFKLVDNDEDEMIKLTDKKQANRIEDISNQGDENIMLTLRTLIGIYKQLKSIESNDIKNLNLLSPAHHLTYGDLTYEIYFPAIVKVYFKEFTSDKHKGVGNPDFFKYMEYCSGKGAESAESVTFNKVHTQAEFRPKSFLDIVFGFYERMQEYEQEYKFMEKLDFGTFVKGLLNCSKLRNRKLYENIRKQLFMMVDRRFKTYGNGKLKLVHSI